MDLEIQGGGQLSVADSVFGRDYSEGLVHQALVAYMAAGRAGTKAQKTRSEVHGTTKKFKRQKGGGARHGAYTAPIFIGGGVNFAAKTRDHSQKLNRKMYRAAMQTILSELVRQGRLSVVAELGVDSPKTKDFVAKMAGINFERGMIVADQVSENLHLASRNVPGVFVTDVHGLNPVRLVGAKQVVVTAAAMKQIEEWLS